LIYAYAHSHLAHGSYYILGASSGHRAHPPPASPRHRAAVALVVALRVVMERFVLRRLPQHESCPALMTFGIL